MAKFTPWSPKIVAELIRLDTAAAGDPKLTFDIIAARINRTFGTSFTRNAIAGQINKLKAKAAFGPEGRKPRQSRQKPAKVAEAEPAPQKRPRKRKLVPPALRQVKAEPKPEPVKHKHSRRARLEPWLPAQEPSQSTHVTLMQRKPWQCGWPVNDGGPFLYCGALKTGDPVYCDYHRALATGRHLSRIGEFRLPELG
jgi:hypothetical protein